MAIFSRIIIGVCALASLVHARPALVTVTDVVTVTEWETVNSTTTVWRPLNQKPVVTSKTSVAPVVQTPSATPSVAAAVQAQPSAPAATPPAAPAPTPDAQPPAPQPLPATSQIPAVVAPQPAPSTFQTSTTPSAVAAAPVYPAPASSAAAPAAPAPAPAPSAGSFGPPSASASNSCEGNGAACEGDVTHWDGGLGACGWNVNSASDMQVALPVGFMGTQSNGNPYCGRSVTLYNPSTGTTVSATVGDKCMGCTGRAINCTDALFNAITDGKGDGREGGIQWWLD